MQLSNINRFETHILLCVTNGGGGATFYLFILSQFPLPTQLFKSKMKLSYIITFLVSFASFAHAADAPSDRANPPADQPQKDAEWDSMKAKLTELLSALQKN